MHIIHSYHPGFSGGIGDFLRGSCYLHNLCKENGIKLSISWKYHILGKFISAQSILNYKINHVLDVEELALKQKNDIQFHHRLKNIVHYIVDETKNLKPDDNNPVVMSSFYLDIYGESPLEQILNYSFSDDTKTFLQNNVVICDRIKKRHQSLIKSDFYGTIHFRLGDRHCLPKLNDQFDDLPEMVKSNYNLKTFDHDYDYLYYLIQKNLRKNDFEYLVLLADCNEFKKHVADQKNNRIIIPHYNSNHSASAPGLLKQFSKYNSQYSSVHAEDTSLDISLLTGSIKNISYSVYSWGSGFVIWPSKIFNVPLEAYHLNYE